MKKMLSLIVLALICLETNAQLAKGNIQLGGAVGMTATSNSSGGGSETESRSFTIAPKVGYFVSDRAVVGIGSSFYSYKVDNASGISNLKNTQQTISVGPYYRYYFPMGEKFAIYLHSALNLDFGKYTSHSVNGTDVQRFSGNSSGVFIYISPGVNYFLNKKWGLEASFGGLSYRHSTSDNNTSTTKDSSNILGLNLGIDSFSLGLKYFITR